MVTNANLSHELKPCPNDDPIGRYTNDPAGRYVQLVVDPTGRCVELVDDPYWQIRLAGH